MAQLAVMAVMAAGQLYKGKQAHDLKQREKQAYLDAADRAQAAMTYEVQEERRRREFMYSRALAVAGAQTGDPSDAGIQTLLADLNAEGDYRILSTIWVGVEEAEGLRFRAEAARREAEGAKKAGRIGAITSAISGYVGMGGASGSFGKWATKNLTTQGQMDKLMESWHNVARDPVTGEWTEIAPVSIPKGVTRR